MPKEIGIPTYNGPFVNPFMVLWSPKILLPSLQNFPPSIGFPPPTNTIPALEIYPGTINIKLKTNIAIQSAQLKMIEITMKFKKIKVMHVRVRMRAI